MEDVAWEIGCITVPLVAALVAVLVGRRWATLVGILAAMATTVCCAGLVYRTATLGARYHELGG